jgi:DnaK suppressor protein
MQPQAMYNPGLFCPWQELKMPAKKALSKKRNKVSTSRKKVTSKKPTIKKKIVKKKVGKKKVAAKKVSKKKAPVKKAAVKKATKKMSKKKAPVKKVAPKKAIKKAAGKELAQKKKAPIKKAAAKRAIVAKKVVTNKAPARKKTPVRIAKRKGGQLSGPIHGIAPYKPARGEEYMSDEQLNHFRDILNAWKSELIVEVDRTVHHMQDEAANFPDPNDRATQESEFGLELRTRDRERKLLRKIESALRRIDDNSYGFCDKTGEEIGLKRLEARPVATLSLEAQERREQAGRQFRDHDDRYR